MNNQITIDEGIARGVATGDSVFNGVSSIKAKKVRRSNSQIRWENLFRGSLALIALLVLILVLGIMITLIVESMPSIKAYGFKYITGTTWDPVNDAYGAWPFLVGTLETSFLALIISVPFSFAIAI